MVRWWRGIVLGTVLVAVAIGCGKTSSRHPVPATAHGGSAMAGSSGASGQGGRSGLGGTSAGNGAIAGSTTDDAGTAGSAAASGQGGAAGGLGSGGQSATSGSNGLGGTQAGEASSPAGAAGEPPLKDTPAGWTCLNESYDDGICDCGCGALDRDCSSRMLAECERCNAPGSCSPGQCPGRIDYVRATSCTTLFNGWTCASDMYGDGHCDCYCGVRDPDCQGAPATDCPIPWEWRCRKDQYGDGASCDCGCGAPDPDCEAATPDVCDTCSGCAHAPCQDLIDADDNARCIAPADWKCARAKFGDGVCDCGCGLGDADCPFIDYTACERCPEESCAQGSCGLVQGDGPTSCWDDAPEGWTCEPKAYRNGVCNCGCGAPDYYDCSSSGSCEICDAPGSCSSEACPGTIDPVSAETCVQ